MVVDINNSHGLNHAIPFYTTLYYSIPYHIIANLNNIVVFFLLLLLLRDEFAHFFKIATTQPIFELGHPDFAW